MSIEQLSVILQCVSGIFIFVGILLLKWIRDDAAEGRREFLKQISEIRGDVDDAHRALHAHVNTFHGPK